MRRKVKIYSWNVCGFRAVLKKGFLEWFRETKPDIICLQEIKANSDQLDDECKNQSGYEFYINSAERKGYSGVAVYAKAKPVSVSYGMNDKQYDNEGRIIEMDYGDFLLFNVYFPNGGIGNKRVSYKLGFYDEFFYYLEKKRKKQKNIIVGGDFNTAHKEIDLARPKENEKNTGFLQEERAWMDKIVTLGYVDTFRMFHSEGGNYTYWDYYRKSRERNVGWRLDYFFVTKEMKKLVVSSKILKSVMGSDHCPIELEIKL